MPMHTPLDLPLADSGGSQSRSCSEGRINGEPTTKDIEHVLVPDDPRAWGYARKVCGVSMVIGIHLLTPLRKTLDTNTSHCVLGVNDGWLCSYRPKS
jgi:hypothetical protein